MPQENVEIVRRGFEYEIHGRGDAADFDPEVVLNPVEEGASHGWGAIRDNFERWRSAWHDLEVTAEEFVDAGDRILVTERHRGRGRASGIEVEVVLFEVYTLRNGKIVRVDEFTERSEALEAAGLSE